ncbi:MAG: hypothetical protein H6595_07115 [Flavobacteriales bacterium]|nr:hypothetical protein [Flavobacteriales bacterium]MCB9167236.1 hypothetical protein [Flavobacteriales bacterium]
MVQARLPHWRALIERGVLLALLVMSQSLAAQQGTEGMRVRKLVLSTDSTRVDTFSIAPGTFSLQGPSGAVPPERWTLDPFKALLIWNGPLPEDTLVARFRVFPLDFTRRYAHKDEDRLYRPSGDLPNAFRYEPTGERQDLFGSAGLNKTGSISRGILFGNNQDLSVNSSLNLELSGKITDRINVLASITDNNIPIQADGNTAELQDFDQVFIKLFEDDWELTGGDLVLQRPKSHFLTYLKKSKGLSFDLRSDLRDRMRNTFGTTVAISKGKFARNTIQGIEGVQGPYRLRGNDGERFIIVLSGTERVYVDGQPMQRGQDQDYVIDYNTAEVTFTPNRPLTKDKRIVIEFQYSDKNYMRSLVRLDDAITLGRSTLRLNIYSEQDHRDQPLQQSLTDDEKQALADAGDDPNAAAVPGADSVAYSVDEVLYARIDSLGYTPVYRYSTNADSAHYRVTFSEVGSGMGDYMQKEFTANGRVYEWLAPDTVNGTIVHRGDRAPVRVLVAPRSQQLIELGFTDTRPSGLSTQAQIAWSRYDANTFSQRDDGNDQGLAARLAVSKANPISRRDSTLKLDLGVESEGLTSSFRAVERFRPTEFERDWNATTVDQTADQLLLSGHIGLIAGRMGRARYSAGTYQVRDRFSGVKHDLLIDLHPGHYDAVGQGSYLTTSSPGRSEFLRHKLLLDRRTRWFTVGIQDEHERNRFRSDTSTALTAGSYQFLDWQVFVQSPDTFRNKFRLAGGRRYDQALRDGGLARSTVAGNYSASLILARDPRDRITATFTYRDLRIIDTTLTAQRPEETYLGRIDQDLNIGKGFAVWNFFYELGSGLEQRREFIYLEVPAGQGIYVWIDYNGDGLKDLNEFEPANFGYEANYIRVFIPSDDYVRAFSNQFSASLDLRPGVRWAERGGILKFIGRFSDQASVRSDRKTSTSDLAQALVPLRNDPRDPLLTSFNSSARNTFYYDRTSRIWSLDHTYQNDRSKSLLLNGYESRVRESNTLRVRWNTSRAWTLDVEGRNERIVNGSDLLEGRTYGLRNNAAKPRVTWQPNTSLRAAASFRSVDKRNRPELGDEHAVIQDLGLEFRWSRAGKGTLQMNADWLDIRYNGEVNSSLGNEMLEGLKVGTNLTWSVLFQQKLSSNLQVDLTYNGRYSENATVVHVGGAQVRAFF